MEPTVRFPSHEGDSADCIGLANAILAGALGVYRPPRAHLIRIDNWFDFKWRRFSGKVVGILGVWGMPRDGGVAVPPFHPHRVLSQSSYRESEHGILAVIDAGPAVHVAGPSGSIARTAYPAPRPPRSPAAARSRLVPGR